MDDSSVIKIADRRAAHTETTEEPKPTAPQMPASEPPKRDARPASPPPVPQPHDRLPPETAEDDGYGAEEEPGGPPQQADAGQARRPRGGMRGPSLVSAHVVETAGFMMEMLLQKAFITMGLMPNPETGRRERDLEQTRIAIDLLTATAEQMRGRWGMPGVEQDIEAQLTSLRLQFARLAPPDTGKA